MELCCLTGGCACVYLTLFNVPCGAVPLPPNRDDEIRRTIRVLCRRTKNNPVLIGEPGVGKVRRGGAGGQGARAVEQSARTSINVTFGLAE